MTTENSGDQTLVCRDCKANFIFTEGEQKFFAERQFTPPTRCKACRQARKAAKEAGAPMAPAPGQFTASGGYTTAPIPRDDGYPPPRNNGGRKRSGGGSRRSREDDNW